MAGYVSRVAADGSAVLWTTIALSAAGVRSLFMAQDSSGNIDLFGQFAPVSYRPGPQGYTLGTPELFAEQLRAMDLRSVYSTNLGESADASAAGIMLDSSGNAWLAGTSSSAQFPALDGVPNLGADFVLRLDPAGAKAQTLFRFPRGVITAPPAMDSSGNLLLPGSQGHLLIMPPAYAFDTPGHRGLRQFGIFGAEHRSIWGRADDVVRIRFDGFDTGLAGFDRWQPCSGAVRRSESDQCAGAFRGRIQRRHRPGGAAGAGDVAVRKRPGGPASRAVHWNLHHGWRPCRGAQPGRNVNSPSNPAARGSIVSLFGTGVEWPAGMQDGATAPTAMPLDQEANKLEMFDSAGLRSASSMPGRRRASSTEFFKSTFSCHQMPFHRSRSRRRHSGIRSPAMRCRYICSD